MTDCIPVALIVDDPPINTTYWIRRQAEELGIAREPRGEFGTFVADWRRQEPAKIVPNDFWREFAGWAREAGVRGKFSFLPCPAGLGYVDDKVEGFPATELSELLGIVREGIAPRFDITPEFMTHTMAWDVENRRLLPVTEWEWADTQSEAVLTDYLAEALRILKNAGITATGVTQPCSRRGDEMVLARAVLAAMKRVCGVGRTFYFLHADGQSLPAPSKVMIGGADSDEWVVSIVSGVRADEPFWASLYGAGDVEEMAEYFISADGRTGRLVDLLNAGGPVVFHAHSQTLYSNGTQKGFRSLQLVADRINRHLGRRVRWATCSDVAAWTVSRAE